ncbi:DUF4276 family protein [Geomonas oryzisoli]|uniref:DUF4276 family protein n=1 Tax=Geomonas oryzisoli TaxID=2847992 RepID=A0ABX8J8X9_9BACT|nr:DUF4276 family protein [Geomonas oryzisoli]QWV94885.1 DUF4276 family protein [Geomonas oryzisoli]
MKIGIIVDGQAESQALRFIVDKIKIAGTQIVAPLYSDLQPRATPHQIVRSACGKIEILNAKNVDQIVLLIDLDDRRECHVAFADSINKAISDMKLPNITAVVKNKCFENWLIADHNGISKMVNRFKLSQAFINSVCKNKADNVLKAEELINSIANKTKYKKGIDSVEMSKCVDPMNIALNSRSFRRFLRVIGHSKYSTQSKQP